MRIGSAGVVACAVAALLVSACDGGGTTVRPTPSATGGQLVIWADEARAVALRPFAARFAKERGVTVDVRANEADLRGDFLTASRVGQAPDIVVGGNDWIGEFVRQGAIEPVQLSDAQRGSLAEVAVKGVTLGGQVYGVPYAIDTVALIRNTELAPLPPVTFEEIVAIGKQLQAAGKVTEIIGLPVGERGDLRAVYPLYASAGGYLFGTRESGDPDPSDLGIGTPASVLAFNRIAGLGEKGAGALKRSVTPASALAAFTNGQTAYLVGGPEMAAELRKTRLTYEITQIPGFAGGRPAQSLVDVRAFFLASRGQQRGLARDFLAAVAFQGELARALHQAQPHPPVLAAGLDQVRSTDPDAQKFLDIAKGGTLRPVIPEMAAVPGPFGTAEAAAVGGADVPATVQAAAIAITTAIG